MKRRRGRPAKLTTEKGELKLLAYIEGVARYHRFSIRKACKHIAEGRDFDPDPGDALDLYPVNQLSGWIDGHGWFHGTFVDDPARPASALNYSENELRKTYYRLKKRHR